MNIIEAALDGIGDLLQYRKDEITKALGVTRKASYSITVKMEAGATDDDIQVLTRLTLVPERIRDENIRVANTKQLPLGLGDGEKRTYNMGGKGGSYE